MFHTNKDLVDSLIEQDYLKTGRLIKAFEKIDRKDFVRQEEEERAYANYPLSIGFGQTISQPATVAFMLELLKPQTGDRILEIGSGSGWQTALLAEIVSPSGKVFAIERIPELKEFGEENVANYNFLKKGLVDIVCADGSRGLPDKAPFDRIVAAAAARKMPEKLKKQLKPQGRLVLPIKNSIWLITKEEKKEYPGFAFVPLIEE